MNFTCYNERAPSKTFYRLQFASCLCYMIGAPVGAPINLQKRLALWPWFCLDFSSVYLKLFISNDSNEIYEGLKKTRSDISLLFFFLFLFFVLFFIFFLLLSFLVCVCLSCWPKWWSYRSPNPYIDTGY